MPKIGLFVDEGGPWQRVLSRSAMSAFRGSFVRVGHPYDEMIVDPESTLELLRARFLIRRRETYVWTRLGVKAFDADLAGRCLR